MGTFVGLTPPHLSGANNFEVSCIFLENMCTPLLDKCAMYGLGENIHFVSCEECFLFGRYGLTLIPLTTCGLTQRRVVPILRLCYSHSTESALVEAGPHLSSFNSVCVSRPFVLPSEVSEFSCFIIGAVERLLV